MSTHKQIDRICCGGLVFVLLLTILFMNAGRLGVEAVSHVMGYESALFDTSIVHTIDIEMEDWEAFLENCTNEEYTTCSLVIDQAAYKNVAIRAKGNTSLTSVDSYGNNRYSFKIEFDHYDQGNTYYGLDKLCLNNIIQDNTYMKDYVTYRMMSDFGVDAPLCSFAYITVNGEDFGLYLAVEGVEESFLERNYGKDYGELYKPDSMNMGGGRGNGAGFVPEDMEELFNMQQGDAKGIHQEGMPAGGPGRMSMGSEDVSLIYTDDRYDSYSNIFDSAKTDITDSDKDRLIASLKELNEGNHIENVVDVEEVIRYFVVHNFVCNFDSYTGSMIHNYYLYEKDGQLSMIPWDYNLAFGGFESGTDAQSLVNYPMDSPVSGGSIESRPMLAWIFASEEYTELYHQYFAEFIEQYFKSGKLESMINSVSEMIASYVEKDPTKFCSYEEFQEGVSTLKLFCTLRAESIQGQLDGSISSTGSNMILVSEEQETNDLKMVEAANLSIEAMGSMGNGFGIGDGPGEMVSEKGIPGRNGQMPENFQKDIMSEHDNLADGIVPDEPQEKEAPFTKGTYDMRTMSQSATLENDTNIWILIGFSTIVLFAGVFYAYKYKKYV